MHTIGIIGGTNGLGKRFADFFREKFPEKNILVSGRTTMLTNEELVKQSDLVIFSVPIGMTREVILSLKDLARPGQVWTDFTSVKGFVMETFEAIPDLEFCGLHPLFGPLRDIKNQKMVFCPGNLSDVNRNAIMGIFEDFEVLELGADEHDRLMGVVQCVSHFSDFVLGKVLRDLGIPFEEILRYASAPYRIKLDFLARIFAQNPVLYTEISRFNPYGEKFQVAFVKAGQDWLEILSEGNTKKLQATFLEIEHFMGDQFCEHSWEKSQLLLAEEARLHVGQSESMIPSVPLNQKIQGEEFFKGDLAEENLEGKWVVFGEECSHTDEASGVFIGGKSCGKIYRKNIFEVFDVVAEGDDVVGIVPYENSTKGSVFDTLDELFDRENVRILGAQEMDIAQNLLVVSGTEMEDIEVVFSHPQALAQSQKFLRKFCPQARLESVHSTAVAARRISEWGNKSKAAIGSGYAAKFWGLEILAKHMEQENNRTRFVKIVRSELGDEEFLRGGGDGQPQGFAPTDFCGRVSFVVWFDQDRAGNLAEFLMFLSQQKINLTKLDSRRASEKYGGYLFFFDAEVPSEKFAEILPDLRNLVGGIKVLGKF